MTDEELDQARALEAERQLLHLDESKWRGAYSRAIAERGARLAREGWRPEDPLLKEARALAQALITGCNQPNYYSGCFDNGRDIKLALAALKRGMELAKANP